MKQPIIMVDAVAKRSQDAPMIVISFLSWSAGNHVKAANE
jgi:hypothetical protein